MPLSLLFISIVLLALWILNDSGEISIEKMRLQNTADSTAYSVAVLMARNWNYAAYMNRAMVANQAAIGQAVGYASWMQGCKRYVPLGLCNSLGNSQINLAQKYIQLNDTVLTELSKAQNNFNAGAQAAEVQLSSDVTVDNDPNVQQVTYLDYAPAASGQASIGTDQFSLPDVTQLLAQNGVRFTQFQNVVIGSQDHFTANRSYHWSSPGCGFLWTGTYHENGGSELIRGTQDGYYKWEWTSLDTLSCYGAWFSSGESPKAWAAAHALTAGAGNNFDYVNPPGYPSKSTAMWGGAWTNPKAAQNAANDDGGNNITSVSAGGLRNFLDVANDDQQDNGSTVLILVKKSDSTLWVQKNWKKLDSSFTVPTQIETEADGHLPNNQLTAAAKAQIYFYRPYETGSHTVDWNRWNLPGWITGSSDFAAAAQNQNYRYEHGSLYSPFWDAHLVDTSNDDRLLAMQYAGVN